MKIIAGYSLNDHTFKPSIAPNQVSSYSYVDSPVLEGSECRAAPDLVTLKDDRPEGPQQQALINTEAH